MPFDLTEDDFELPVFCPALGVKLEVASGGWRGVNKDNSPSLDKIIPALGYVKGNVVVISNKANRMKNDGTTAELRRIADFYEQLERKEKAWLKKTTPIGPSGSKTSTASPSPSRLTTTSSRTSTKRMGSNVALIDGDILAYKAAFGNETLVDLGDDIVHLQANLAETEDTLDHLVANITDKLNAEQVIVCLSDDDYNFRKSIYEGYKRSRLVNRKPLALRHAKEALKKKFDTKIKTGLEADDVLGILCTHPTLIKGKPIIVTIDKDLLQIPGRHFNPDKDVKRMVSETQGTNHFLLQTVTGDSVDNYPGCPGIGPKRAEAAFAEFGYSWDTVIRIYEKQKKTADDALVQARVARILQHTDYDFKTKEPILWTP